MRSNISHFLLQIAFSFVRMEHGFVYLFIYLFIYWRLSTQDKLTKQWHNDNANVHSKVPIEVQNIQTSNHCIKSPVFILRPSKGYLTWLEALPHVTVIPARLELKQYGLSLRYKPQGFSLTMYRCHHLTRMWVKTLIFAEVCCDRKSPSPKSPSSEVAVLQSFA